MKENGYDDIFDWLLILNSLEFDEWKDTDQVKVVKWRCEKASTFYCASCN